MVQNISCFDKRLKFVLGNFNSFFLCIYVPMHALNIESINVKSYIVTALKSASAVRFVREKIRAAMVTLFPDVAIRYWRGALDLFSTYI